MAKVKIGADTTGFSAGLARMGKDWEKFKANIGKKMSIADLGKGFMQGLGIGSVQQIGQRVTGFFQMAADAAQLMYERTDAAVQAAAQLAGLRQNPGTQIKVAEKDMRAQQQMIDMQRKLVDDLDSSPLKFISDDHQRMLQEANRELAQMEAKLGQSRVAVEQLRIAEKKRQQTLRDSRAELKDQRDLMNNNTDSVGLAEREAQRAYRRMKEGFGTPGGEERTLELERANLKVEQAKKERDLAQLRGIKADALARVGGGGGVYAPGGARGPESNPAQVIVAEARKHTALLQSIDGKLGVKFSAPAATTLK